MCQKQSQQNASKCEAGDERTVGFSPERDKKKCSGLIISTRHRVHTQRGKI